MGISSVKVALIRARNACRTKLMIAAYRSGKVHKIAQKYSLADVHQLKIVNHELYMQLLSDLEIGSLQRIAAEDTVKVAFVLYSASMWSCDELYSLFEADPRFTPYLIVSRYSLDSNLHTFPTFQKTCDYFKQKQQAYRSVDLTIPKSRCYEAMGCPDIIFYLTPYSTLLPVGLNECYMPSGVLCIYIPYSYMLIPADSKFECDGMTLSWRHFADSAIYRQMLISHSSDYERNTYFVGYPKMDEYYKPSSMSREEIWKIPENGNAKCIIYAPHHSLRGSKHCASHFSTFDKNGKAILQYAREHPQTTSWIVKPHPNLKMTTLETGVFKDEKEYYAYLDEWNSLPNAKVVEEATYYDIFKTSDAMLCDSVSFLAEYQFTGKPLLLLTRPDQAFNEFGKKVADILYKAPGTGIPKIFEFLSEVVIGGNDTMKEKRHAFFEENMDYRAGNRPSASEQIFEHICVEINKFKSSV